MDDQSQPSAPSESSHFSIPKGTGEPSRTGERTSKMEAPSREEQVPLLPDKAGGLGAGQQLFYHGLLLAGPLHTQQGGTIGGISPVEPAAAQGTAAGLIGESVLGIKNMGNILQQFLPQSAVAGRGQRLQGEGRRDRGAGALRI